MSTPDDFDDSDREETTPDRDYEVGYGRPPKHSRFKKGQSGNPKGRPKGSKNVDRLVIDELMRPITVVEDGKRKRMPTYLVAVRQAARKATSGDAKAVKLCKELLGEAKAREIVREATEPSEADRRKSDKPMLDAIRDHLLQMTRRQGDGDNI